MTALRLGCFVILNIAVSLAHAEHVNVAVASNFASPIKAIVDAFELSSEHKVSLSFGSSGKFYAQIRNGAPFSVFFSADQAKPIALEKRGLTVDESRFTYAVGQLVLWSPTPGYIEEGGSVLKRGRFRRLALANPKVAPYGVAASETLESLGLKEKTQPKWVRGENIAQTYQFTSTGNADLGFVALSQIIEREHQSRGEYWLVPSELHSPILQDVVLLQNGKNNKAAASLMHFVRSEVASEIIKSYGYTLSLTKHKAAR